MFNSTIAIYFSLRHVLQNYIEDKHHIFYNEVSSET